MYEQLDLINLKNRDSDLRRELREARWAKEAEQGKQRKAGAQHSVEAGIVSVLVNALNIR